ncbi:flagellar basal body P-ring formation chaperone FlgA [Oricola sp.]|uniref:flagellar basal body P-ring formation chaperone FlgA n=1 Tax=Oricola sp. TaxID=1979950 RepID=UPI000C93E872|nr:flagella basal body P-ring formation protein FlgA [Ahrensia sp.]MCK5749051.1 flagellar basal body P-ring formation protein FlgA [Oricola sp.]|tara:strand:+ start:10565 stop:11038 length:474 start_codon:yes stop_codon:yes gene_type:complete
MTGRLRHIAGFLAAIAFACGGAAMAASRDDVVITVNRVIYPGQIVPADAVIETHLRKPLRDGLVVIRDAEDLVGMVAAKTILPKRLIAPNAVREAFAIEAGDMTTVYYRHGALTIAMDAVALQSAGFGDPIRIRNTQSGRTISGIVMPDGSVAVESR